MSPQIRIKFLQNKSVDDVRELIQGFSQCYSNDLQYFQRATGEFGIISPQCAMHLSMLLKKRKACRPSSVNKDLLPLLEELESDIKVISNLNLRTIRLLSSNEKEAIIRIWSALLNRVCTPKKLTGVAPSKVILILTNGRLGPALDSYACRALGIQQIVSAVQYLTILFAISEDIAIFEKTNFPITLEELIPKDLQPVYIGRAYDMAVGPRV